MQIATLGSQSNNPFKSGIVVTVAESLSKGQFGQTNSFLGKADYNTRLICKVQLTYSLTGFDSDKQVNLLLILISY